MVGFRRASSEVNKEGSSNFASHVHELYVMTNTVGPCDSLLANGHPAESRMPATDLIARLPGEMHACP